MQITYLKVPLNKMTFTHRRIREWVEGNARGRTLNLFAGKTLLSCDETRVDSNPDMKPHYCMDALDFVSDWDGHLFDTVILDPPYSFRKSMEMYDGHKMSPFNAVKNRMLRILAPGARVITFGYQSVSMGRVRGFKQVHLVVMYHGGAIHDTLGIVEQMEGK